jgi:hypothetical protein
MSKFEDQRINDLLKDSEAYKSLTDRTDPNDKMIRAFLVNKESLDILKKTPNSQAKLITGTTISLELGSYVTSNGRVLAEETFKKHYKQASSFVKTFLKNKISLADTMPDIMERIQANKIQKPNRNTPKA